MELTHWTPGFPQVVGIGITVVVVIDVVSDDVVATSRSVVKYVDVDVVAGLDTVTTVVSVVLCILVVVV